MRKSKRARTWIGLSGTRYCERDSCPRRNSNAALAVSLGGTESLVEHPMSMTHADVPPEDLERNGVTAGLIRMSVGLEHLSDLRRDLRHALSVLD